MKVAISIPDSVFTQAESLAKRKKMSRSKIYAAAVAEYVARHDDDELTAMANLLADSMTAEDLREQDAWLRVGAETVLKQSEW